LGCEHLLLARAPSRITRWLLCFPLAFLHEAFFGGAVLGRWRIISVIEIYNRPLDTLRLRQTDLWDFGVIK
jgi:hypothetical protein